MKIISLFLTFIFYSHGAIAVDKALEIKNKTLDKISTKNSLQKKYENKQDAKHDIESLGLDENSNHQSVEKSKAEIKVSADPEIKSNDMALEKNENAKKVSVQESIILPPIDKKSSSDDLINANEVTKEKIENNDSIFTKIKNVVKPIFESEAEEKNLNQIKKNIEKNNNSKTYSNAKNRVDLKKRLELEKKIAKEKIRRENLKLKQEKERRLREEKMMRLNKLREEYLIKIKTEQNDFSDNNDLNVDGAHNQAIILPKEKFLNWSDRFTNEEEPAPPILDRSRVGDNKHIPIILSESEKVDAIFSSISSGNISSFNESYKMIMDPDAQNISGDTILTYATLLQRHDVMLSILSKGADPDLVNSLGHTPLDIAIEMLDLKAVQVLHQMQADINIKDKYGRTYLMHAARVGFFPVVEYLVSNGVLVNEQDAKGHTALSIAYRHKKDVIVKYLLTKGAKTWIENTYKPEDQIMIKDLNNRWKKQKINSFDNQSGDLTY